MTVGRNKPVTFSSFVIQRDFNLSSSEGQMIQNVTKEEERKKVRESEKDKEKEEIKASKERSASLDITKIFRDDEGNEVEDMCEHLVRIADIKT